MKLLKCWQWRRLNLGRRMMGRQASLALAGVEFILYYYMACDVIIDHSSHAMLPCFRRHFVRILISPSCLCLYIFNLHLYLSIGFMKG
ncbi:hypothetical protein ES332_A07G229600v1 [Gossypium tomentosum]|uniref:Uncharacterized protein n=1 Tax=Gossypium tomentosum TaxID=34277 RepID=A0A5D2PW53_GOSTO|nr:hypothetical protein ES332_A07G229600v1 [Gossypium tomentosum]